MLCSGFIYCHIFQCHLSVRNSLCALETIFSFIILICSFHSSQYLIMFSIISGSLLIFSFFTWSILRTPGFCCNLFSACPCSIFWNTAFINMYTTTNTVTPIPEHICQYTLIRMGNRLHPSQTSGWLKCCLMIT